MTAQTAAPMLVSPGGKLLFGVLLTDRLRAALAGVRRPDIFAIGSGTPTTVEPMAGADRA